LAVIGSVLLVVGCGDDQLDEDEAREAWQTTQQSVSSGESEVKVRAESSESGGSDAEMTVDVQCSSGGSATFQGQYWTDVESESGDATGVEAELAIDYSSCERNGIVIDGTLDYMIDMTSTDQSTNLVYNWDGDLEYSGDVEGNCMIDLRGEIDAGTREGASYSYEYSGSICGHDANQVTTSYSVDSSGYDF
jgi:hypothetical protein